MSENREANRINKNKTKHSKNNPIYTESTAFYRRAFTELPIVKRAALRRPA